VPVDDHLILPVGDILIPSLGVYEPSA
jgi:hypothetical protein